MSSELVCGNLQYSSQFSTRKSKKQKHSSIESDLLQTLPGVLNEFFGRRLRSSDKERLVQVTVIAAVKDSHVNIDDVAVLKLVKSNILISGIIFGTAWTAHNLSIY